MWISRLDFDYSICAGSDWKDIWIVEKIYNFDSETGGEKIKIQSRGAMVSCRRMPQILNAKEYT